jgi:hypothetical protein
MLFRVKMNRLKTITGSGQGTTLWNVPNHDDSTSASRSWNELLFWRDIDAILVVFRRWTQCHGHGATLMERPMEAGRVRQPA